MRTILTAQQTRAFTQNGYIELGGIPIDVATIFQEIEKVVSMRKAPSYIGGRDVFRDSSLIQNLLLKTVRSTLTALVPKQLRLACDQWIPKGTILSKKAPFKDLFSIQNLAIGFFLAKDPIKELPPTVLGLSPFPKDEGNLLFVTPTILLDLPLIQQESAVDLYFACYSLENGVYIHNEQDPATHLLKNLGYHFGERLKNPMHPLLIPPR